MCANEDKHAAQALGASMKKPAKRSVLVSEKHKVDEKKETPEGTLLTGYSGSLAVH
jgi:hypothetical protein